jgi:putative restriction endonuclease
MAADDAFDARVRLEMFAHLDRLTAANPQGIPSSVINQFVVDGEVMRLIVQPGIRKPRQLAAALTIRTAYTPLGSEAPYADSVGSDGLLRYKWRGTNPDHPDNRALREAMVRKAPLAYFAPIDKGVYEAIYPVYLVAENLRYCEFTVDGGEPVEVAGTEDHLEFLGNLGTVPQRRYAGRLTQQRLHQALFRPKVLRAYGCRCALCRLGHATLLDAAHILPDRHKNGDPIVPNGLALCKIHHAAYDVNIVGIRPDLVVEIRRDILDEIDGPMLRHGLQEMHGSVLSVPRARRDRPDPARLEERYASFRAAA